MTNFTKLLDTKVKLCCHFFAIEPRYGVSTNVFSKCYK